MPLAAGRTNAGRGSTPRPSSGRTGSTPSSRAIRRSRTSSSPCCVEQLRPDAWAIDLRGMWPPQGAVAYDGIIESIYRLRPLEPSWSIEAARRAVEADVASVEAFKASEPAKAATVAEALDTYGKTFGSPQSRRAAQRSTRRARRASRPVRLAPVSGASTRRGGRTLKSRA